MKKSVLILLIFLSIPAFAGNKIKIKNSKTTYVYDALLPFTQSQQLPGAIGILYNNGIQETCCIGYADVEHKRPITLNSAFMQCSQTKGFCGVTIAKLVEEGKLSLDDPVSKYLPEFATLWVMDKSDDNGIRTLHKAKNVLTVKMVLNHTGGFPFEISAKQSNIRGGGWSGGAPLRQTAAIAASSPLSFEPGTKEQYSNTGIDIGAAIVEIITGMKWEDYLRQEVLLPLGMKSTWFWPTDAQIKNKIELYSPVKDGPAQWLEENPWEQRPYNDSHVFASAGAGLWTTANDQIKFYKMLMNLGIGDNGVRILKEETVKQLLAVSTRLNKMGGYSLGLNAPKNDSDSEWFGHGGAFGTNCMVNWHKKQLRLYVQQISGGPQPWTDAFNKAAEKFFKETLDQTAIKAYTNRTK